MNLDARRYVWLTLVLISWIMLSYMFFFQNLKKKSQDVYNKKVGVVDVIKNKWDDIVSTWWDIVGKKNDDKTDVQDKNGLSLDDELNSLDDTNMVDTGNVVDSIVLWNITLQKNSDTMYDDIFDILWFLDLPKYKVEWKKIYIKKIDSIEYNQEKSNIKQLIQKIWGNIAEVNWFWDKQLFVNLDPYYKKDSISLVEYNWNLYIMVLPYNKYYEYEKVIKEFLFDK